MVDQTNAVRTSTGILLSIVLLLSSQAVTAAITTASSTTGRGTLQALIGHQATTASPLQQQLYLQAADGSTYALDLPRHLGENFDAAAAAGSEVEIRYLSEEGRTGASANLTSTRVPLQLLQAPTLSQPDNIFDPAAASGSQAPHHHHHRALRLVSSSGSGPQGPVSMIVYIMDLSACGTAVPVTTPQVRGESGSRNQPRELSPRKGETKVSGFLQPHPIPFINPLCPLSSPPPPIRPSWHSSALRSPRA